jgi:glutathione peroxidase
LDNIYNYQIVELNGQTIDFKRFAGKVILVVNTASKCQLAGQLKGLQYLFDKYSKQGLVVIGIPSNQFYMETKRDSIKEYCQLHYGVSFPMSQIAKVNGKDALPVMQYLKAASGKGRIKFNFTKFLINKQGEFVHRYSPLKNPLKIESDIVDELNM